MRLFRLNKNKLELLRDELLGIPEFSKVFLISNEIIRAEQYFIFIYIYCDYTSPYSAYEDDIRFEKARYEAQLPKDWKMDDIIKGAVSKYLAIRDTGTIKTLKSFGKGLELANKIIDSITKKMTKALEDLDRTDLNTITDAKELEIYNAKSKALRDDLGYMLGLAPKIESSVDVFHKQLKKAINDDFEQAKAAGDKKIGNRADPMR